MCRIDAPDEFNSFSPKPLGNTKNEAAGDSNSWHLWQQIQCVSLVEGNGFVRCTLCLPQHSGPWSWWSRTVATEAAEGLWPETNTMCPFPRFSSGNWQPLSEGGTSPVLPLEIILEAATSACFQIHETRTVIFKFYAPEIKNKQSKTNMVNMSVPITFT